MIDTAFFDEKLVKSYLSINSNFEITKDLLSEKCLKNIAELFGFAATIQSDLHKIGLNSGFNIYLEKIKALPANIALQVLTTPAAFHWNAMTRQLLNAVVSGQSQPILDKYLDFLVLSFEDGLNTHLNDFGRFIISAHILTQTEFESEIGVTIKLPNTFPGTKLAFLNFNSYGNDQTNLNLCHLQLSVIKQLYNLSQSKTSEPVSISLNSNESILVQRIPSWKGKNGEVIIDAFEICLNLPYIEIYPRIKNNEKNEKFINTLNEALNLLTAYNGTMAAEIELITSSITLMDTSGIEAEMCSGTSSAIFGAYFLSQTDNPLYLAEMLLHEFCHNKLRLLEEIHPFLLPDLTNIPQFYSPWRDDPRPLDGIQHGLYVFSSIAYFWLHICLSSNISVEERTIAQRRVATLLIQLKYAETEFSNNAKLTEFGRTFVDEIKQRIQFLEESVIGWNVSNLLPFFSGIVKDKKLKEIPLVNALRKHKLNWEQNYRIREVEIV